jgi:tRNA (guanine-N(7)-)-methyltransferase
MGKTKMYKINSVATFPNVYQNLHYTNPTLLNHERQQLQLKGVWRSAVFKNDNPLILELACGKGDYTIGLAVMYPQKNFLGIDVKGARIFTGAKTALEREMRNVAFARMRIENILNFFAPAEIDEIWITFPDPFPRKRDAKRRLSAKPFLEKYKQLLKPGGIVHLKTDDLALFHFTRESVIEFGAEVLYYKKNIYADPLDFAELAIQTYYEKQHLAAGKTINYMKFRL